MRSTGHSFGSQTRFLIFAPFYQPSSNGIRVLYTLAELLREVHLDALVVCYDHDTQDVSKLPDRFRPFFRRLGHDFSANDVTLNDIVVYPDVVSGNPLSAHNSVRYLLNRPFVLTGEAVSYGPQDLVVAYSGWIDVHAPRLFLLNDDRHLFYPGDVKEKKDLALVYFGKNPETEMPSRTKEFLKLFTGVEVITRASPGNRLELAHLLRKGKVLVSLDPLTSLCYEATLCNTPVLIPNDNFNVAQQKGDLPMWGCFNDPVAYGEAVREVEKAYPHYEEMLRDNPKAVSEFVGTCIEHFNRCASPGKAFRYGRGLLKQLLSLRTELDELRFKVLYDQKTITGAGQSASPRAKDSATAQLFVETGGRGFAERDSVSTLVPRLGKQRLRFDTSRFDEAPRFRLDPANDAVHCRLESLVAFRSDGTKVDLTKHVRANAALVLGADYFFSTRDPQFVVNREVQGVVTEVEASIDYLAFGDAVIDSLCGMIGGLESHDGQLFVDTGKGFNEAESMSERVTSSGKHVLEYDLSGMPAVKGLRFDPSSRPVGVRVLSFVAIDRSRARIELADSLSGNFVSRDANLFLFNTDDPQLVVGQPLQRHLDRVVVELEYQRATEGLVRAQSSDGGNDRVIAAPRSDVDVSTKRLPAR